MKRHLPICAAALLLAGAMPAAARDITTYVDWGPTNHSFPDALKAWTPGQGINDDDNFFISRVRPRARFINRNTQVHSFLDDSCDKNLIYWVPIGTPPHNSLQSDAFDSDMFSMWQYVTHFGNWSTPMARVPGNFSDAAHRNGVGVSPVVATPWGSLNADWGKTLRGMLDAGADKMSDFLQYYGIDGLGYNSEFSLTMSLPVSQRPKSVSEISDFNRDITRLAKEKGNPLFMNIWYDGTATNGSIMFDRGLGTHNEGTFGHGDAIASSLFFNYNWNNITRMENSVAYAREIGRDPLDLYCGFNMQGGEPAKTLKSWSILRSYPLSIGLWGAHSESMMYESRRELGSDPADIQRNYLLRTEWWFTGGTRNPANTPEISDQWNYGGTNTSFFGMSALMSARSALTDYFTSCFNLGNGTYFNWQGKLRSSRPWANIGIQDVLPTWRFWWSSSLLGGKASDVPASGLDARFIWDDAWLGGSSLQIFGSSSAPEYLHLYKTSIPLKADDEVSFTFKQTKGSADIQLVLTAEGNESVEINAGTLIAAATPASADWRTVKFRVADAAPELVGKRLALIALKFNSASNLELLLGQLSVRPEAKEVAPALPVIARTELLAADRLGADGKIVWNMPDGESLRYNEDHNISMFQLYSQQKDCEPIMQSATSSWAGLLLHAPLSPSHPQQIRFGVAPVSTHLDATAEIVWGEWHEVASHYEISNEIKASGKEFYPGEEVEFTTLDPQHPGGLWCLTGPAGEELKSGGAPGSTFTAKLASVGTYSLTFTYKDADGSTVTDNYPNYVRVLEEKEARAPRIESLTAEYADGEGSNRLQFKYESDNGEGVRSRGLSIYGKQFGGMAGNIGMKANQSSAVAFWLRPDRLDTETHLFSIRDKSDSWPRNEWGFVYSTIGAGGKGINIAVRLADRSVEQHFSQVTLHEGVWTPIAIALEYENGGLVTSLYVNGKKYLPTSYTDNGVEYPGAPKPLTNLYGWRTKNAMSVGGPLFKTGGVEGAIDDFQYWICNFDEEKAKIAASAPGADGVWPEGLQVLYSFDKEPNESNIFTNEVVGTSRPRAEGGAFRYQPQLTEGSGVLTWIEADFAEGAPTGRATQQVKTKAVWNVPGGDLMEQKHESDGGEAMVNYLYAGNYTATLTLENECGADSRTVTMIHVAKDAGVNAATDDMQSAMVSKVALSRNGAMALCFDAAGSYEVEIHDVAGNLIFRQQINVTNPEVRLLEGMPLNTPLVVTTRPL